MSCSLPETARRASPAPVRVDRPARLRPALRPAAAAAVAIARRNPPLARPRNATENRAVGAAVGRVVALPARGLIRAAAGPRRDRRRTMTLRSRRRRTASRRSATTGPTRSRRIRSRTEDRRGNRTGDAIVGRSREAVAGTVPAEGRIVRGRAIDRGPEIGPGRGSATPVHHVAATEEDAQIGTYAAGLKPVRFFCLFLLVF